MLNELLQLRVLLAEGRGRRRGEELLLPLDLLLDLLLDPSLSGWYSLRRRLLALRGWWLDVLLV